MKIQEGAKAFLMQEFTLMSYFIIGFAIVVFILVDYVGAGD